MHILRHVKAFFLKGKVCSRLLGVNRSTIWYDHSDSVFNPWARTLFLPYPSLSFRQVRHSINNVSWVALFGRVLNHIWVLLSHLLIIATITLPYAQQICSAYWCNVWSGGSNILCTGRKNFCFLFDFLPKIQQTRGEQKPLYIGAY